jgi:protein SCO1/2
MRSHCSGWLLLALMLAPLSVVTGALSAQSALDRPFALLGTSGHIVTDKDLRGGWLLVFFGYTNCPDICPTTLNSVVTVLDRLGPNAARLRPVFITVDPARDTSEALRAYVTAFDPRIIALTGDDDQIGRAAATFGARFFKEPGTQPGEFTMAHSAMVYVIGPEGGLVTQFANANDPDTIATTLATLMK